MAPVSILVARKTLTKQEIDNLMPMFIAAGVFGFCSLALGLFAAYHCTKLGIKRLRIRRQHKRDAKHQAVVADDFFRQMGSYVLQTEMSEERSTETLVSGFGPVHRSSPYGNTAPRDGDALTGRYQKQLAPVQTLWDDRIGYVHSMDIPVMNSMQVTPMGRPIPMPQRAYSGIKIHQPQPLPYKLGRMSVVPDVEEMLRVGEVNRGYGALVM